MKIRNLAMAAILAAALPVLTACPEVDPTPVDPVINPEDTLDFVDVRYGTANCVLAYDKTEVEFDVTAYAVNPFNHVTLESWKGEFKAEKPVEAKVWWSENTLTLGSATLNGNKVTVSGISGTGNGGVVILNEAGEILWSYHIWKPEIDPTAKLDKYRSTGNEAMIINLGATKYIDEKNNKSIPATAGCYYQWGRKDPLGRPTMLNARNQATSAMVAVKSIPGGKQWKSTSTNFLGDTVYVKSFFTEDTTDQSRKLIAYSIKNPTTFITSYSATHNNWSSISAEYEDNYLWGAMKTCYDPCPEGYQVGSAHAFSGFCGDGNSNDAVEAINALNKDMGTSSSTSLHGYFFLYSGAVETEKNNFYPACGSRNAQGIFNKVGLMGYYYSYTWGTAYGRSLIFGDKDNTFSTSYVIATRYGSYRGSGYQIRCVKEMVGQVEPEPPVED